VVVVRGRPGITGGPIVVGVDSSTSGHAVGVAFSEAETRGSGVVAIRAFVVADPPLGSRVPLRREDREQRRDAEFKLLLDDVAPWKEKYPEVAVECVVLEGHAGEVLVGLSSTAQLVVVGTSGHGSIADSLLGSVVLRLLHRADCPVFIAR
jgi:nucleotide-binding universal stress UspA family protein